MSNNSEPEYYEEEYDSPDIMPEDDSYLDDCPEDEPLSDADWENLKEQVFFDHEREIPEEEWRKLNAQEQEDDDDQMPVDNAYEAIHNFSRYSRSACQPVKTGFTALDSALGGGICGLCVCGGLTGVGKSAFALQLAAQIPQHNNLAVYYYLLEMSTGQMLARLISRIAFEHGRYYSEQEIKACRDTLPEGVLEMCTPSLRHLNFVPRRRGKLYTIKAIVEDAQKKIDKGEKIFIIIDYLQIAATETQYNDRRLALDSDASLLEHFCEDNGVSVLAISSLNRKNYREEISLEGLKESGGLEYSADQIIGLQLSGTGTRDFDYSTAMSAFPRKIVAKILKNRNGSTERGVSYDYYPVYSCFYENTINLSQKQPRDEKEEEMITASLRYARQKGYIYPILLGSNIFGDEDRARDFVIKVNQMALHEINLERMKTKQEEKINKKPVKKASNKKSNKLTSGNAQIKTNTIDTGGYYGSSTTGSWDNVHEAEE